MASHRYLVLLPLLACAEAPVDELELAESDALTTSSALGAADAPSWDPADTLHANSPQFEYAAANGRRVHSLWIAGTSTSRVPMTITARAAAGHDVRIAVLGPLKNGARPVLAADGYASAKQTATASLQVATSGEHLVVVGSYNLARETFYTLDAACSAASCASRVDVLHTPKDMALVGNEQRLVQMQLGSVMAGFGADIAVEVWASPPMQWWNGKRVGTSYASGTQVNMIMPTTLRSGDDLRLVVRQAGGRVLDTGVTTRYVPVRQAFARLDSILYGDLASMQIAGVVGFFEGQADLRLRSETYGRELARDIIRADRPGMIGNGFNAFDATFEPKLTNAARNGELLSVGWINGNAEYKRLGCFQYCNDLSGMASCTGGPRACP
jgi:hypothetical protein